MGDVRYFAIKVVVVVVFMSPVSSVLLKKIVSIGLNNKLRVGTSIP